MNDAINQESSPSYYGWVVVGMAFLINLVTFGLVYSFSVFFKPLIHEFGWSRSSISGAFAFYAVVHNVFALPAGRMTDRFGPRVVLYISGFFLGLSMVLMGFINIIWELYFCYGIIFSLGVGGIYAPMMATVSRWFVNKRGLATGTAAAGLGMGALLFSPLTAWLITSFGWRIAYIVLGIISWLFFFPAVRLVKRSPIECKSLDDQEYSQDFSFLEAFRTRAFWAFSFSLLFVALAVWAIMVHLVPLFTDAGLSLVTAGKLAGLLGAGSMVGRLGSGFFSDNVERKNALIVAFLFQLIILIWLFYSNKQWMFFVFAVFFGISYGGWSGIIGAFPADYFGIRATGSILGFAVTMAGIGVALGPYLGGYIYDSTKSYHFMIMVCIFSTALAIIFALNLGAPPKKKREDRKQVSAQ